MGKSAGILGKGGPEGPAGYANKEALATMTGLSRLRAVGPSRYTCNAHGDLSGKGVVLSILSEFLLSVKAINTCRGGPTNQDREEAKALYDWFRFLLCP